MKAIPFIYFSILFIFNSIHKKRIINVSNLLIGVYALSGLCFLILSNYVEYYISIDAALYYLVCMSLLIIPHIYFDEDRIRMRIVKLEFKHIKLVYVVYFLIQLSAILFYLPDAIGAIRGDIFLNRILVNMGEYNIRGKTDLYIAFVGYSWPISLTMFFYCVISREKIFYSLMFLVCSLFGVIYVIAHAGRSGITLWFMLFLFNYIFFKKYVIDVEKTTVGAITSVKLIKLFAFSLLVLLMVFFVTITTARFLNDTFYSQYHIAGPFMTIIDYFGQSYGNFALYFTNNWLDQKIYYGQYTLPLLYGILKMVGVLPDFSYELIMKEIYSFHLTSALQPGTFNTLLKELSIDYGLWGLLVLCVLYCYICIAFIRNKARLWGLPAILTYTFLFTIPYYGIFFYAYGDSLTNFTMVYYIISTLLLSRLLKS